MQPQVVKEIAGMESTQVQAQPVLILKLTKLRTQEGLVRFAVFSSAQAKAFPTDATQAIKTGAAAISELPLKIPLTNLPFGCYAATVFHDENANGEFDMGRFGIPQEGFGFSQNPPVWKGAPRFRQAQFEFSPDRTVVEIAMKYL